MILSTAFSVSPSTLTDILASWLNRQAQPAPAPPPYGATAGTVAAPFPLVKITRQYGTQITPGTPHTPPPPPSPPDAQRLNLPQPRGGRIPGRAAARLCARPWPQQRRRTDARSTGVVCGCCFGCGCSMRPHLFLVLEA
jgi:hypothetical protein